MEMEEKRVKPIRKIRYREGSARSKREQSRVFLQTHSGS